MKVLIVDDCAEDRMVISDWVNQLPGYSTVEAETITSGLEAFSKDAFEAVFLDYAFPTSTAHEFLEVTFRSANRTPIIVMSGQGNEQIVATCMKCGASDYISKSLLNYQSQKGKALVHDALASARKLRKLRHFKHADICSSSEAIQKEMRSLKKSQAKADAANASKSVFLANMSHEIRSPLTSIIGFTDLIQEASTDPSIRDFANAIERNGKHLLSIINEILDFSKIEAGKVAINKTEFAIRELVNDVALNFEKQIREKNLKLRVFVNEKIPDLVLTDRTRVRQILTNLVSNAVKFTSEGEITIVVKPQMSAEGIKRIAILVTDSGEGMSKAETRKLFKRFSQTNSGIETKYGGTGLGLTISQKYANLLGGDLELISSERGVGSIFRLTIPCLSQSQSNISIESVQPVAPLFEIPAGIRVMIVDDSTDNQILLKHIFLKYNLNVTCFSSGWDAIEQVEMVDPEIVLMDVQMPSIDGHETSRRLRKLGFTKAIIGLTANALPEDEMKSKLAGFDVQLTKPIDKKLLIETIGAMIGHKHLSLH